VLSVSFIKAPPIRKGWLQAGGFFDRECNVLVCFSYSDQVIAGSPQNSIRTVPIMGWPAPWSPTVCTDRVLDLPDATADFETHLPELTIGSIGFRICHPSLPSPSNQTGGTRARRFA
jgi:hypothetical protein